MKKEMKHFVQFMVSDNYWYIVFGDIYYLQLIFNLNDIMSWIMCMLYRSFWGTC